MAIEQHRMREAHATRTQPKKKLNHIRIEKGKSGGHVVTHVYERGSSYDVPPAPEEQHVFGQQDGKKMMAHVAQHMGVAAAADDGEDEDEED